MARQKTLPRIWLLSDARNDAVLEAALARLPRGSGFVFRHHHLAPADRRARFARLARIARARGHLVILAGTASAALAWGADGAYGAPRMLASRRAGLLALATVHDLDELAAARRIGADAVLLSPVFPTRSHPGAPTLGALRFRAIAARASMPVIALGGMNPGTARRLGWPRWAAVDGLCA
jgi:thiamine-phosphate pyrophosphorylase